MDFEDSGFSDAGDSGWTTDLDCSSPSMHHFGGYTGARKLGDDEEEVDSSMVSDASSGPRYYCEEVEEFFQEDECSSRNRNKNKNKNKKKLHEEEEQRQEHQGRFYSCLDDTASSLYVKNINRFEKEVSTTQRMEGFSQRTFKVKSAMNMNLDFLQAARNGKSALDHRQGTNDKRKRRG